MNEYPTWQIRGGYIVDVESGVRIAQLHGTALPDAEANARLLASAPELKAQRDALLAACDGALPKIRRVLAMCMDGDVADCLAQIDVELMHAIQAAQARGETEGE